MNSIIWTVVLPCLTLTIPEIGVFRSNNIAPDCITGRSATPLKSETPSARWLTDFNEIHTRVPASSLTSAGAGIADDCCVPASGILEAAECEAATALTPVVAVAWTAPRFTGRAGIAEVPESGICAAWVAVSPRAVVDTGDADASVGLGSSGAEEIAGLSMLAEAGGVMTPVSVSFSLPGGAAEAAGDLGP
jgi:hypothetical protein